MVGRATVQAQMHSRHDLAQGNCSKTPRSNAYSAIVETITKSVSPYSPWNIVRPVGSPFVFLFLGFVTPVLHKEERETITESERYTRAHCISLNHKTSYSHVPSETFVHKRRIHYYCEMTQPRLGETDTRRRERRQSTEEETPKNLLHAVVVATADPSRTRTFFVAKGMRQ